MTCIWCNGEWLDAGKYPGAAQDRGAFFGLGLFETLGGLDGRVIFAERHLARLRKSCDRLGWDPPLPDLGSVGAELLERNSLSAGRSRLRLVVTGGSGPHNDLAQGADHLVWLTAFAVGKPPASISMTLSPWPRNERSPLAGLKTSCYAENLVALDQARRAGFDETLFLNTAGDVCEAATANIFLVKNGKIVTPSLESGCLPGIGREVLCELAEESGIPCEQRPVSPDELRGADEIFISSSTRGPVAVERFEDRVLERGEISAMLQKAWERVI